MPYKELTSEQIQAVQHEGNLLLTACPGSGKTKTLVSKLCYMLENSDRFNIGKKKIVALTYTNVAADTIYERLMSFGVSADCLWIGTIHSFCLNWIVKPNVDKIPRLHKGFSVIDEHEKEFIINEIKEKYEIDIKERVNTLLDSNFRPQYSGDNILYRVVKDYHTYLYSNKLIDFELILNLSERLLKGDKSLCQRLSLVLNHILVDEYQDISSIQYEILKAIISAGNSFLTLIGDKEQAIYTGLGAIVKDKSELMSYFNLDHLTELRLTGCFRSSQMIVDFYSKYKDESYEIKSLSKYKDFCSVIHKERSIDVSQLPSYIIGIIQTHLNQGVKPDDIAVLCPSWFDVIKLSNEISVSKRDFEIDGVTISPIPRNNENFWLRFIKLILIKKLPSNFIIRQKMIREFYEDLNQISPHDIESLSLKKLASKINNIAVTVNYDGEVDLWLHNVITIFCHQFSLDLHEDGFFFKEMLSLINATKKRMLKYKMVCKASDLHLFFNFKHGVKITSCHSTKGDEYDVVICTGLLNGKIPNWKDIIGCSTEHSNYIARRLLYVISSRAKKHLYMISEKGCKTSKGKPYKITLQL